MQLFLTAPKPNPGGFMIAFVSFLIQNIAMKDANIALVKTGDLKHKGDYVHFDSESQRKSERYAEKYLAITTARNRVGCPARSN